MSKTPDATQPTRRTVYYGGRGGGRMSDAGHSFHHLMGMSEQKMMERLQWLEARPHFPSTKQDADFLYRELARVRRTVNGK